MKQNLERGNTNPGTRKLYYIGTQEHGTQRQNLGTWALGT